MNGWHGITTVTIGNCGFGFAPCKPENQRRVYENNGKKRSCQIRNHERGMPWDWETHPEFMDSIENTPKGVNVATFTPWSLNDVCNG